MKNKKTYLLASLATLTTASAVVTPLALSSCSEKKSDVIYGEEFDKEYDVNESTLIALVEKFKNVWNKEVDSRDDWSDEKKAFEKDNLVQDLNQFNKSFANSKYKLSYTMKTHVLINFAKKYYGLDLSREDMKADWSDIKRIFDDACDSFELYMQSEGIDPIKRDEIIEKALDAYKNMMEGTIQDDDNGKTYKVGLKAKYPNDPLAALVEAKAEMMSCFANVNKTIALTAASINLQKFAKSYNIYYSRTKENGFDQLVDNGIISKDKIGTDLSENMTKIFKIVDFLHPDREIKKFDGTKFIPGFTIVPVLHSVSTNKFTNEYAINIDWQCYKTEFSEKDPEELKAVTAHIFKNTGMENEETIPDDVEITDYFKNAEIQTMSYQIPLTPEREKEALKSAYIDESDFAYDTTSVSKGKVDIGWFSKSMHEFTGYEAFKQGRVIEDKEAANANATHYLIDVGSLLDAELEFKVTNEKNGETAGTSIYKLSDYFISKKNSVFDVTQLGEEDKPLPEIATELINNCNIYSDAIVDNDIESRNVQNTINMYYKNSSYVARDGANIFSFNTVDTSGFKNSKVSYGWLTRQFNSVSDFVDIYLENPYAEQWKAAREMKGSLEMFFGLATALNILCFVGSLAGVLSGGSKWIFFVDLILIGGIQYVESKKFILFKNDYYDVVKDNYEKSDKLIKSKQVQDMVRFLKTQQTTLELLRTNEGGEITKTAYEDNFDKKYSKLDPGQIQTKLDLFASIKKSPEMTAFLDKVVEVNEDWKSYKEYMKQWEEEGKFYETMDSLATVSSALCMLTLVWTIAVMASKPTKTPEDAAVENGVGDLEEEEEIINAPLKDGKVNGYNVVVVNDEKGTMEELFVENGKYVWKETGSIDPFKGFDPVEEPLYPSEKPIGLDGRELSLAKNEKAAFEFSTELKWAYNSGKPFTSEAQVTRAAEKRLFNRMFKRGPEYSFAKMKELAPDKDMPNWSSNSSPYVDLFKVISEKRGSGKYEYENFADMFAHMKTMAEDSDASNFLMEQMIGRFQFWIRDMKGLTNPEVNWVELLKQGPEGEAKLFQEMDKGLENLRDGLRWDRNNPTPDYLLRRNYWVHDLFDAIFEDIHNIFKSDILNILAAVKITA